MKKIMILFILIPFLGFSQIKKGNQWAFINLKGNIVIDFRDNLVLTETNNKKYPVFINERCLISEKKDGISYFGYIDTSGATIIEPQFLNATNFDEEFAIAIELYKEILGKNNILNKQTVRYESTEVIINKSGIIIRKLTEPKGLALSRNYINKPPKISSKIIAENLFSALGKDNKIIIKKIKE
jgi:hypothetical protein